MTFSVFLFSCAPRTQGDPPADPKESVSESWEKEVAAEESGEPDDKASGEGAGAYTEEELPVPADEEVKEEQTEEDAVPDSAVYDAGEKSSTPEHSGSDRTDSGGRAGDEGEIVIPGMS